MALPSEIPFAFVLTVSALPYNGSIHPTFAPSLCLTMFESLLQTSYPLFHRCPVGRSIGSKKDVSNTPKPPTPSSTTGKYRIWVHKHKVSANLHVNARLEYLAGLDYNLLGSFSESPIDRDVWAYILAKTRYQSFVIIDRYKAAIDIWRWKGRPSLIDRGLLQGEKLCPEICELTGTVIFACMDQRDHQSATFSLLL